MTRWKAGVVASCLAALVVILVTAYLEAEGIVRWPWPPLRRQIGAGPGHLFVAPVVAVGPYLQAFAGMLLQFVIGLMLLYAAPERMRRLTDSVAGGWGAVLRYLLTGALLAAGLGAVSLLSAFYVHTALLPFVLGSLVFLAALVGAVGLAFGLGRELLRRAAWAEGSPLWSLLVGTTLLYALTRLPVVGPGVMLLLGLIGAGAALATRFGGRRSWTLEPLREVRQP